MWTTLVKHLPQLIVLAIVAGTLGALAAVGVISGSDVETVVTSVATAVLGGSIAIGATQVAATKSAAAAPAAPVAPAPAVQQVPVAQ